MVRKRVIANYWVECVGEVGWRIAYRSTDINIFYFIGDTWTPDAIGAKVYPSSDEAILALTKLTKKMMDVDRAFFCRKPPPAD